MDSVNKTLYIPLYSKAYASKKGVILNDKKAEEIWGKVNFPLKRKSKSKWLAYYMAMRARVFDTWLQEKIENLQDSVVLHIGCGMDSRNERVGAGQGVFYDIDFPAVINERRKYYQETQSYQMLAGDIKNGEFLELLPNVKNAVVVLEGVSMYLTNEDLQAFFLKLTKRFESVSLLVDCYTPFGAKMSKIKNPIKEVGVSTVYGVKNGTVFEKDTNLTFVQEKSITPPYLIDALQGFEKVVFRLLYGGGIAKKIYKLYEYQS